MSIPFNLKQYWLITASMAGAIIAYAQFAGYPHISWDDPEMVFRNRAVQSFNVSALFSNQYVGNYIPLTMVTHALGWLLAKDAAGVHHILSLLFHLVNGWLVYRFARSLRIADTGAQLAAAIFLLHPLQVESVGWIGELKTLVSALFCIAAFITYVSFTRSGRRVDFMATLLLFIAGCLSKPTAVAFPLCLVSIDIFLERKWSRKTVIEKVPFFLTSLIFGIVNIYTQTAAEFINHSHEFPFLQRIGNAGYALLQYLRLTVLPIKLSVIYPFPERTPMLMITGFVTLAALGLLAFYLYRKRAFAVLGLSGLALSLVVLVLQFVPFGEVLYADRYMYLPLAALACLAGYFSGRLPIKAVALISGVLLVVMTMGTFARGKKWENAVVLYEDILKKYPHSFVALNSAGVEHMMRGNDEQALEFFTRATINAPRNYKGFYNKGLLHLKKGEPEAAIKSFNQSLRIYDYAKAFTGRASANHMLGKLDAAFADARSAIARDPLSANAHFVLGNCFNEKNLLGDALSAYNRAIEIEDREADFYFKRAIVYGKKRDFSAAMADLNKCIALNKEYVEAYYWRGVALVNLRRYPCADFRFAANAEYEPAIVATEKYCK